MRFTRFNQQIARPYSSEPQPSLCILEACESVSGLATIKLNRSEKMNSLNSQLLADLNNCIDQVSDSRYRAD
jgi:hypothetical protein